MEAAVGVALQFSAGWAMSARSGSAEILMARKILPELFFRGGTGLPGLIYNPDAARRWDFIYTKNSARPGSDFTYTKNSARLRSDLSYTKNSARLRSDFTYTKNLGRTIVKNQRSSQKFSALRAPISLRIFKEKS